MTDTDPTKAAIEKSAEICRMMARLEKETYEAWLERTRREAAERAKALKEKPTR